MTDPFAPPKALATRSTALTVLLVVCAVLGLIGLGTSALGGLGLAASYAPAATPEQQLVMDEIRASQGWWVMPLGVASLVLKVVLSLGLLAGGALTLSGAPRGPEILRPTLVFGIVYELASGALGLVNTMVAQDQMSDQFGKAMQTDPNLPPEAAAMAGSMFGAMMLVSMAFMLVWAAIKAGLYFWTRRELTRV